MGVCREDPRFPTVRGVLRRGMTVEGLKLFIAAQVNQTCAIPFRCNNGGLLGRSVAADLPGKSVVLGYVRVLTAM